MPIAWRLFRRNLSASHRRSLLGYLWLFMPMLATGAICLYLQARDIVSVMSPGMSYPLFVLSGMLLWQLFMESLEAPLQRLQADRQLITRSRVPHEALLMAGMLEVLLNGAIRLAGLLVILLLYRVQPGANLLLVPVGMVALLFLGTGIGLILAPLGLLYDDIGRAMTLLARFWFFLTPVLYPIPGRMAHFNPVTPLLDTTRMALVEGRWWDRDFWEVAAAGVAFTLLGWLLYRLARPHVVARLG